VDYCHNAPAMVALGDFVDKFFDEAPGLERPQRIGVIATAGDRRDSDMVDLGAEAGKHFERVVVREDQNLRGRRPRETAALIATGVREAQADGGRVRALDIVPDEIESTRVAVSLANPGDLVVLCVDRARAVWDELETIGRVAQAGGAEELETG
jgi:cyanophycin synthetase